MIIIEYATIQNDIILINFEFAKLLKNIIFLSLVILARKTLENNVEFNYDNYIYKYNRINSLGKTINNHSFLNIFPQVPTWKRNILRMFVVLTSTGLAILFRNSFALVAAFTGENLTW